MKLVILDVDGTLTPRRPSSTAQFTRKLLPGVAPKLAALRKDGVILAIASNQGGAQRGRLIRLSTGQVMAHFCWLKQKLDIASIRFATQDQRKKPNPSMLNELMAQFSVQPEETMFVGDALTDKQAAEAAGILFAYARDFFKPIMTGKTFSDWPNQGFRQGYISASNLHSEHFRNRSVSL